MSNKKRIRKRIQKIEIGKVSVFTKALGKFGKNSKLAAAVMAQLVYSFRESIEFFNRQVQVYSEYKEGIVFTGIINDPEFDEFVLNMRMLTGYTQAAVNNLCISLPKEHWKTCEGLVSVGFSLEDAVDEIIDAYKLMTHCS